MTGTGPIYKSLLPSAGQVVQMGEANRQREEERQNKLIIEQMKEGGKTLDKAFAYKADPVMAEYQPYFADKLKGLQDKWAGLVKSGHPDAKTIIANDQADLEAQANIVKDHQARMNQARITAKDPLFNSTDANIKIAKTIRDENGNLIEPMKLDPDSPLKALKGPGMINPVAWAQNFAKGIDADIGSQFQFVTDTQGRQFMQKWYASNKFAKMKPGDTSPEYDPKTGRIQLNITPDLLSKAMGSEEGQQLIQEKIDEHKGDKNYGPSDALKEILYSSGYANGGYKKELKFPEILNREDMKNNAYFSGSGKSDQKYLNAAGYFHDLIHGDPQKKNSLLGDFQARDWSTSYQNSQPKGLPASKNGYVVVNYDPANKAAMSVIDALMSGSSGSALPADVADRMKKEHKFYINLDNEGRALTELNYWRNQGRTEDVNPDYLRKGYDIIRKQRGTPASKQTEADKYDIN